MSEVDVRSNHVPWSDFPGRILGRNGKFLILISSGLIFNTHSRGGTSNGHTEY
jgi:hypothetical protein